MTILANADLNLGQFGNQLMQGDLNNKLHIAHFMNIM